MVDTCKLCRLNSALAILMLVSPCIGAGPESASVDTQSNVSKTAHNKDSSDRFRKMRVGKASYYGPEFYGKKMANGKRMNPNTNVAASKELPLGTKAKVTNLKTGKSAVVNIEDRGPYVKGRIVDLSPKTAQELDMKKAGVAPVEVKPLVVPQTAADESEQGNTAK